MHAKNHSQPIDIKITRQTINNPSVNLEIKGDVAVLTVSRFDKQTAVLARQEAEKIKAQGISKVVLIEIGRASCRERV